ncbi:MAG: hypothetical protein HZY75_11980 [Nocardioidaceae bacterium]|nr:MAG: hypothetical protein HZY75_11980 [Nocardioidaceae bacterium]
MATTEFGSVARAAAAELAGLPQSLRDSTLAASVLDLARRLDGEPGDRDAAGLSRELRLSLAQLHGLASATPTDVLDVTNAGLGG